MTGPTQASGVARGTVLVGLVVLGALAALWVPWEPVPGGAPQPPDASTTFTASQIARGEAFGYPARWLSIGSLAISLGVGAWLAFSGRGRRLLERWGDRIPGPWPLRTLGLVAAVLLVGRLATLPISLRRRSLLIDYGLTRQELPAWALDQLKSWGVGVLFTSIGVIGLIACARRWTTWWPAIAGALGAALVVLGSFVYPLLIEPIFNDFETMPDGQLRQEILRLADQENVDVDDVLIADASRRTTTLNAYVSGFGGTRRVVVYDNLVQDLPQDQVLAVVAHELAHAQHDDVLTGTTMGAAGAAIGVGLLGMIIGAGGVRRRAGVSGVADPRVVALVLLLASAGQVLAAPVENAVSRRIEMRADVDALDATEDPAALLALQRTLCIRAVCDPEPPAMWHWWWGSHPSVMERVALAEQRVARTQR